MRNILLLILLIPLNNIYLGQTLDTLVTKRATVRDTLTMHRDTSAVKDSSAIRDTAKILRQIFIPKNQVPLGSANNINYIIDKEQILFNDYRFTGDLLERFPLSFSRNLQTLGQPHEVMVYGAGLDETSYLKDGLLLNNRLTNSFDLNDVQSESIDSIEIIPSPRGFLYGAFNNQASVNFISNESSHIKGKTTQYTRLRYYQAQNQEAMVDFMYQSAWFRRIISTFEITNKTYNDPQSPAPANSDYSLWNGTLKLKYLLSNSFNITGTYNYIKTDVGLYGGLTAHYIDSLKTAPDSIDLSTASVYSANRHNKNNFHNVYLQIFGNPSPHSFTDFKAYYRSNLMEFRQNEHDTSQSVQKIFDNNRYKLFGVTLRQSLTHKLLNLDLNSTYEVNDFKTNLLSVADTRIKTFSLAGSASLKLFDSSFIPSVFGKYLNYNDNLYSGIGVDVLFKLFSSFQFYAGLSYYQQPNSLIEEQYINNAAWPAEFNPDLADNYRTVTAFETGVRFNYKNLKNGLTIFSRNITSDPLDLITTAEVDKYSSFTGTVRVKTKYLGLGASINYNIWRVYLESYGAYYYNDRNNIIRYKMPEYTFRGGIYYRDTLFEANLHLKAGIYAQYTGAQSAYTYDFEREMRGVSYSNTLLNIPTVSPSLQLDFRLVGQVQERAILYFTVENLLGNKKYYIIPYYINPGRNLRIGISWEFIN